MNAVERRVLAAASAISAAIAEGSSIDAVFPLGGTTRA
jgi:hypothetical protein